jgi:hypothetical protein
MTSIILFVLAGCSKTNKAPVLTSPSSVDVIENSNFDYEATASDPDGETVALSFANYPEWLSPFDTHLRGVAPWGMAETTIATFSVLVSDGINDETFPVIIKIHPSNEFYLSFFPEQISLTLGQRAILTANINNVENLFAISFDIIYDTLVMRAFDVGIPQQNFIGEGGLYFYHSIPGGVSFCLGKTQTDANDNLTGSGPLVEMHFIAVGQGFSQVRFNNINIVDENGGQNQHLDEMVRGSANVYVM